MRLPQMHWTHFPGTLSGGLTSEAKQDTPQANIKAPHAKANDGHGMILYVASRPDFLVKAQLTMSNNMFLFEIVSFLQHIIGWGYS